VVPVLEISLQTAKARWREARRSQPGRMPDKGCGRGSRLDREPSGTVACFADLNRFRIRSRRLVGCRKIALERIHVEGPALVQRRTINVRTEDLLGNSEFNDPPDSIASLPKASTRRARTSHRPSAIFPADTHALP
jgi:hypothetical protein